MPEIFDEFEVTQVSEMAAGASTLVPLTEAMVNEIVGDDPDPKFATYIIEGGWSKSKRYYGPKVLDSISEQINTSDDPVVGYKGHISPDRDAYDFPDIQCRWVRSKIQAGGDKVKLLVKAYLLPGTKAREYAERGLKVPISIRGNGDQRPIKGGVEVSNFELESIDMARPRKAGMGGRLVGVTSEMEEGREVDGKDIAALTYDDLKSHNSLLLEKIESDAKKPLAEQISEMEKKDEAAEENVTLISKLREALGISEDADILEVVGKTLDELKKNTTKAREGILNSVLEKRFKDDTQRGLVRRILATEMEDAEIPDDAEAAKIKIAEMVNTAIDEDEQLKALASEMDSGGGANLNGGGSEGEKGRTGKKREIKPGYENERIKVRPAR